jgi:hypothetical protein
MAKGMHDRELSVSMSDSTGRHCQWTIRDQYEGGNISGHDPEVDLYKVPDFQGMSGQANNQSTDRPKGST